MLKNRYNRDRGKEQTFAKGRLPQEVKEMRKVSKPIKMLAEFTPDEGAPIPRKFKWSDGRGYVETVIVDEVVAVDDKAHDFVIYDCISYYENNFRSYQLMYWHSKHLWELYKI